MKKTAFYIIGILLLATSCQKDTEESNGNSVINEGRAIEDLQVSEDFDWKTTKNIEFVLVAENDAVVSIESENGGVYEKGFIKAGSRYQTNLVVSKATDNMVLNFNNKRIEVSTAAGNVEYTFQQ